jgi:prepilin-type N-terminal cleavage/methylation domain-containing protein
MKTNTKKSGKKKAFTIIELLTVMSIIVILMSLLLPGLNQVKRFAKGVKQRNQLRSIDTALEMFNAEWGYYPPSDRFDDDGTPGKPYCGAMKLAEAIMGRDLVGVHKDTLFLQSGKNGVKDLYLPLYPTPAADKTPPDQQKRRGPYLPLESVGVFPIVQLYPSGSRKDYESPDSALASIVLCDVYGKVKNLDTGQRVGMPILYYRANTSKNAHNTTALPEKAGGSEPNDIYDIMDNDDLVALGQPFDNPTIPAKHPIWTGNATTALEFYKNTENKQVKGKPYRADTYILMSAGYDGLYGTDDDIYNFEK